MRTFEGLLWIVSAVWVLWLLMRRPSQRASVGFTAVAVFLTSVHLAIEGARFHMGPTYAIVAALFALTLSGLRSTPRAGRSRPWIRLAVAVPAAILLIVAAALPTFFPVFTYAKPTGPYGIGTAEYELKNGPHGRDLVIQAWYPAAADVGVREPASPRGQTSWKPLTRPSPACRSLCSRTSDS